MNKKLKKLLEEVAKSEAKLNNNLTIEECMSFTAEKWADELLTFVEDKSLYKSDNSWVIRKRI